MPAYRIYGGPCEAGFCPAGTLGHRFATLARSTTHSCRNDDGGLLTVRGLSGCFLQIETVEILR